MPAKIKVGRLTAALLWIVLGVLVIIDQRTDGGQLLLLLTWWPLILVAWGIEYVVFYLFAKRRLLRMRFDIKGILLAVIAAAAVFLVTEQNQYLYLWSRVSLDLTAASAEFSEASGTRTELARVNVPVTEDTDEITIEGINGDLIVRTGNVEQIQVRPVVWVDEIKADDARAIAEATTIKASEGQEINIHAETKTYGESKNRQPRVNMEIVLPASRHFDINMQTTNGKISMSNVEALRNISVRTGSGSIVLNKVMGDVKAQATTGNVVINSVLGNLSADTSQGNFRVHDVSGSARLYTQVGDISLTSSLGDIEVNTRNGNIFVNEANFGVKAETLNGNIEIRSVSIGDDWSVYSAVGVINLYLPPSGDYTVDGSNSYGTIKTDLPLETKNKTLSGTFGNGDHTVRVDGNGDLNVLRNTDALIQNNDAEQIVPEGVDTIGNEESNNTDAPATNGNEGGTTNNQPDSNSQNSDAAEGASTSAS
ncbi:DUF4097 domain-containing protein [Paenibacillus hunanensis]|uniref:DUF4097 family beta strand repeat-containing protein n=1 Tax=Paenibacillus hunanensis TaxID=539262 RepID=UPI0020268E51|nr:DUF4097 family beta strand repeat-containing protein [Paenibacillus hunanensis]MCL9662452.1 DUF4097 domain-containing protein [Paenibacillus hunanensis]